MALLVLLLVVISVVPRTVGGATTSTGQRFEVEVVPGLRTPVFRVAPGDDDVQLSGAPWPGQLTVERRVLEDRVTGRPAVTVLVGSAPLGADSVRLTTAEEGVREATVELVGWHRVHATVLEGEVTATEIVAIGAGGEVLAVLEAAEPS